MIDERELIDHLTGAGPPICLSGLSAVHIKSVCYGAFVWARGALNRSKRRLPARAAIDITPVSAEHAARLVQRLAATPKGVAPQVRFAEFQRWLLLLPTVDARNIFAAYNKVPSSVPRYYYTEGCVEGCMGD